MRPPHYINHIMDPCAKMRRGSYMFIKKNIAIPYRLWNNRVGLLEDS